MRVSCYFVTGAAGFVGRNLCEQLRSGGHRVLGLTRRGDSELAAWGVEVIQGDLTEPKSWQDALEGSDYIVHCAANASFRATAVDTAINVEGTRQLLDVAKKNTATLRRFIFISTIGAIDRPAGDRCTQPLNDKSPFASKSPYGRSKEKAEQLVRTSGLPFAIVRPAMVVGGDMRCDSHFAVFVHMALRGKLGANLAWPGVFSVVHIEDLVVAIILCSVHPDAGNKVFFCAGAPFAIHECFKLARPGKWRFPMGWIIPAARIFPWIIPFKLKALLLSALVADDTPLRNLGWQPRHTPPAALHDVVIRERARIDPEQDHEGQTVITGAASGLGLALLEQLSPRRRHLLLIDCNRAALEQAAKGHPHCRISVTDLSEPAAIEQLVDSDKWKSLPVREIYACAGVGFRGAMLDISPVQHARLFKVNVLARIYLAHAALPGMIRAKFGRIIFISSSSAFQALPYMASYAGSNAALLLIGEAWAAELAGTGVQTLQVCPGGMQTDFHRVAGVRVIASERLMPPQEAARRIMQALKKRRVTVIISVRAIGMSLLARMLPRAISVALWKKLMESLR